MSQLKTTQNHGAGGADEEINFGEYVATLWEGRWLLAVVASLITAVGVGYGMLSVPIYTSNLIVQVEEKGGVNNLASELAPLLGGDAKTSAEIEILRSRSVVSEVVRAMNLRVQAEPKYFPIFGEYLARRNTSFLSEGSVAGPVLGGARYAWGGEKITVKEFKAFVGSDSRTWLLETGENGQYRIFDEDDKVVLTGQVGIEAKNAKYSLLISNLQARPGTQFLITLGTELHSIDKLQNSLEVSEKGRQSGILIATLEGKDPYQVAAILNTLGEAYVRQNVTRKSEEAEKTLAFLDQQLPQLKKELDTAEDRYNRYRNQKGSINLTEEAKVILQQSVEGSSKLMDLQQKRLDLTQRFTVAHPLIVAIDKQIAAVRSESNQIKERISTLPNTEQEAVRLQRDVAVNNELYTGLLNNAQQLRILKAGTTGNVRIVDHAMVAEGPIKPRKSMLAGVAFVLGIVIGAALVFLRKALLSGMESTEAIERITGLPILASIPLSDRQSEMERKIRRDKRDGKLQLLAHIEPNDITVESLRSLRTALQFSMLDAANNIVMISGPVPGVGKSFVSANLSVILAAGGKKILLIDSDLRRGHLHDFFGVGRGPGLASLMGEGVPLEKVIHKNVIAGLDFMSIGSHVPNPAELLGSAKFAELLRILSAQYDLVLIDTPPILAVTDAAIVGKLAGTTLLNLRHGRHSEGEVIEAVKRLQQVGVELKGILLNAIPKPALGYGKYRYYGGYYNYNYKPKQN